VEGMVQMTDMFSGFSVNDVEAAQKFYRDVIGLKVESAGMGNYAIQLPQGGIILFYPKENHVPATYTILNFEVPDIDVAADELIGKGVTFEQYDEMPWQDAKGIGRGKQANMGPDIAWFTDPAGNILSILSS
jgi:predicted enzyme related to lactoylglutathione lyase